MIFLITLINLTLVLVNLYSVGVSQKKMEIIDEKLEDLSMLEKRIANLCENVDSAFL